MIKETNFELKLGCLCIAVVATAILAAGIVPIIGSAATFIGAHYGTPLLVLFFMTLGIMTLGALLFVVARWGIPVGQGIVDMLIRMDQQRLAHRRLHYDPIGNPEIPIDESGRPVVLLPPGNSPVASVPHTYAPHLVYRDSSTRAGELQKLPSPASASLHIPSFAESLREGLIGPGQREVLLCYELVRTDEGLLTGELLPYRDKLENNCTMFLGGASKSGKSTLMTHLAAQEAMMDALFYLIDPHLSHPDKSIARRLEPLAHVFILPPATTDADIYAVLSHAKAEAEARLQGRETALSGRPLVFIVDEVLNLFGRAQRQPGNKAIQQLYRHLALFMRDLGTQYNKFDVNGIFASQYVTKDAFRLPGGGNVDFRDGCQSQGLLRLPPNQAQAMRLLPSGELRGMRALPTGHGYLGFSSGDVIRMAFGNVTTQDIEQIGRMITSASAPKRKQFAFPTYAGQHTTNAPHLSHATTLPLSEQQAAIVSHYGNTGNDMGTPVETAPEAGSTRIIDEVFPAFVGVDPPRTQGAVPQVETSIHETIRRMKQAGEPDRKIARFVGLSGRKYGLYQQVCRELGLVAAEQQQAEGEA
jgi:hypothetical protein